MITLKTRCTIETEKKSDQSSEQFVKLKHQKRPNVYMIQTILKKMKNVQANADQLT